MAQPTLVETAISSIHVAPIFAFYAMLCILPSKNFLYFLDGYLCFYILSLHIVLETYYSNIF